MSMRSQNVLWTAQALRQGGFSFRRIASRMGYSGPSGAYKAVRQASGSLGDAVPSMLEEFEVVVEGEFARANSGK